MNRNNMCNYQVCNQCLLFPYTPKELCKEIGISYWIAMKLYDDKWISFNPEEVDKLDEGQEAELRFLCTLIGNDCPPSFFEQLVSPLPRPFKYRHSEIYYNWREKRWLPIPKPMSYEESFENWLEQISRSEDTETLRMIYDEVVSLWEDISGAKPNSHNGE